MTTLNDSMRVLHREELNIENITDAHFQLPFPDTDLTMNPNLLLDPVEFDLSSISY
ncbi:MAG: hypothetical protein GX429_03315 [Bacteroidales bacterium]|nr:hypothetical protein [Bacteroidales bacterium]